MLLHVGSALELLGSCLKCQVLEDGGRREGLGIEVFVVGVSSSTGFTMQLRVRTHALDS